MRGHEDGLGVRGVERELRHLLALRGKRIFAADGANVEEELNRGHQRLRGWRVHEGESDDVRDAQGVQLQHDGGQAAALDFGLGAVAQRGERGLGEEAEAHAGRLAARAARALACLRLRDGHNSQGVHA